MNNPKYGDDDIECSSSSRPDGKNVAAEPNAINFLEHANENQQQQPQQHSLPLVGVAADADADTGGYKHGGELSSLGLHLRDDTMAASAHATGSRRRRSSLFDGLLAGTRSKSNNNIDTDNNTFSSNSQFAFRRMKRRASATTLTTSSFRGTDGDTSLFSTKRAKLFSTTGEATRSSSYLLTPSTNLMGTESKDDAESFSVSFSNGCDTETSFTELLSQQDSNFALPTAASRSENSQRGTAAALPPSAAAGTTATTAAAATMTMTTTTTASSTESSSFFGAVMRNIESSLSSFTAKPTSSSPNNLQPTTPKQAPKLPSVSPGGFQLLDFVNSLNIFSPRVASTRKRSRIHNDCSSTPSATKGNDPNMTTPTASKEASTTESRSPSPQSEDRPRPEWQTIRVSADSFDVIDWTIKSKLQFDWELPKQPRLPPQDRKPESQESGPRTCCSLPAANHDIKIQHLARQYFFLSSMECDNNNYDGKMNANKHHLLQSLSLPQASAVRWESSLLVWQYPSSAARPSHFNNQQPVSAAAVAVAAKLPLREVNKNKKYDPDSRHLRTTAEETRSQFDLWNGGGNSRSNHAGFGTKIKSAKYKNNKMPPPSLTGGAFLCAQTSSKGAANASDASTAMGWEEQRKREWQQAFQSLYQSWILHVRSVAERFENDELVDFNQITDCYFYACGKGHTILFRASWFPTAMSAIKEDDNEVKIQPEIVISSSSATFREVLRNLGVKLVLLGRWNDYTGEFTEDMLQPKVPSKKLQQLSENDLSPAVKAELLALRQAQALGQTVGADVSITMKSKTDAATLISPKRIPPLVVSGHDDCPAFVEAYLNLGGRIHMPANQSSITNEIADEYPTLLCRKLGPFLHSSLEKLTAVSKKKGPENAHNGEKRTLEVRGTLLPCAVRGLICAVATGRFSDDNGSSTQLKAPNDVWKLKQATLDPGRPNSEETRGRLVIRSTLHEGQMAHVVAGSIGRQGTQLVNAQRKRIGLPSQGVKAYCCGYGESLSTVIWDVNRPTEVKYKLNRDTLGLLS